MADVTIETPTEDDWEEMSAVDGRNFGHTIPDGDEEVLRRGVDFSRFRVARDHHGDIIGVGGTWEFELTLPGNRTIPMGGLTWVSVAVSHRRRGVLGRLMEATHADVEARGEPLVGLLASEGAIYERFGYGVATRQRVTSIDRRRARFRDDLPVEPGAVRIVDPTKFVPELEERWDRYRLVRPGQVDRKPGWFEAMWVYESKAARVTALHDNGFATWTIKEDWADGHPRHTMIVEDLCAVTPEAHRDLWKTILAFDLVGEVRSYKAIGVGDPLPHLLTDPRLVRTVELNDGLWLRPLDPERCFSARSYRTDDRLVLAVDGHRYEVTPDGCTATDSGADLSTDRAGAGSLLLGAVSASELAGGERLTARDANVLPRADAFFGWDPPAHLGTNF